MIEIATFINFPVNSNCYVVYSKQSKRCLIIDPGSEDSTAIISFIEKVGLIPDYIILTHEHFDHIWGVKHLKETYSLCVLCSMECSVSITNPKKNMSAFFVPPGFSLLEADLIVNNSNSFLIWGKQMIEFYLTPGHTDGSICFKIDNYLFTGDTIIKDEKTVTKLPGGSKLKLKESLKSLNTLINNKTIIMSGHGDSFYGLKLKDKSMKQSILVGTGAVAAEVTSYIEDGEFGKDAGLEIKGYIDFDYNKDKYWKRYNFSKEIIGDVFSYQILADDNFVVCISDIQFRLEMINILKQRQAKFINIIHPSALISANSKIGQGNIIYPFCQIGPNAQIGDFNFMTHNTTISHDCTVGNNNFIAGDGLCGHVKLGNNNSLGVRSIVLPHVSIGNNNIIQAGMVVDKSIKDNSTIFYRYKEQIIAIPKVDKQ